jgi:cytochrome c553
MRRWIWLSVLGFSFVVAAQSFVYAMDPPHNMYSDVDCGECHGESLFATDPSSMTPEERRAAQNTMCLRCHKDTAGTYQGASAPKIKGHDTESFYGASFTFVTGCLDCHHPHYQSQQLYWGRRTSGSPGQLFTGMATGISYTGWGPWGTC